MYSATNGKQEREEAAPIERGGREEAAREEAAPRERGGREEGDCEGGGAHGLAVLVDVSLDPVVHKQVPLAVPRRKGGARPPVLLGEECHDERRGVQRGRGGAYT